MSVPAWPMPIQNTNVVMYIAHIWGVRLPAAPMPTQICHAQALTPAARMSPTRHIQAKYVLPGMPIVRMTSRLTSAHVTCAVPFGGALTPCALSPCPPARRRACPQFLQDVVAPRRARELGDLGGAVLQVPEGDRPGRAGLLAGRLHVPV